MKKTLTTLATLLAAPLAAQAAIHDFTIFLDQAQEIAASAPGAPPPAGKRVLTPGPSPAFGFGAARYDDAANTFTLFSVSGAGLVGTISNAHIHRGAAGVSGPVLLGFSVAAFPTGTVLLGGPGTFSMFSAGLGGFPEADEVNLLTGKTYFNVHTTFDPVGEVRGQLVPVTQVPEPEAYAMMLAGLGLLAVVAKRRRRT